MWHSTRKIQIFNRISNFSLKIYFNGQKNVSNATTILLSFFDSDRQCDFYCRQFVTPRAPHGLAQAPHPSLRSPFFFFFVGASFIKAAIDASIWPKAAQSPGLNDCHPSWPALTHRWSGCLRAHRGVSVRRAVAPPPTPSHLKEVSKLKAFLRGNVLFEGPQWPFANTPKEALGHMGQTVRGTANIS